MRVLVTDGDSRAALAIVRSLGRSGHEVLVAETRRPALAHASIHCAKRLVYPDPHTVPGAFVESLAGAVSKYKVDLLVPVSDVTAMVVADNRERFACAVPGPSLAVLERAADKIDMVQTSTRLGIPVPRSVVVRHRFDAPSVSFEGPVVVKPARSRVLTGNGWRAATVGWAADLTDLPRELAGRPDWQFPLLLQEHIHGPGLGVFAHYHENRPVAWFAHRRIREKPPWGGISVLSESIAVSPALRAQATRLLDDLGWRGPAMVEFKMDRRDGVPKLMEVNGRFWGSLQLAVDAGVDFPALTVASMHPGGVEPPPPYRLGVRSRWFWGDVDSLLVTLFGRLNAPMHARQLDGRRALRDFATLWGRDLYYDNPKWSDPGPWALESLMWLTRAVRRITQVRGAGAKASAQVSPPPAPGAEVGGPQKS